MLETIDHASYPDGPGSLGILQRDITFVVSPPEIIFRQYEPFQTYETPLVFKNQTRTAKSVKLLSPESRFFSLSEPRTTSSTLKVAAGLSVSYTVSFFPEEDIDYEGDLVVITEHERFIVQVRAYASRGKLDLKSSYYFPAAPVKHETERVLFVRNVGVKPTSWSLQTSPPWSVVPTAGKLEPSTGVQLSLAFTPADIGRHNGDMTVSFSNGDTSLISLSGDAVNVDVRLSTAVLQMEQTFISLERQSVVTITNNSDITVRFQWKAHASEMDELDEKQKLAEQLRRREAAEREYLATTLTRSQSLPLTSNTTSRELRTLARKSRTRWNQLETGSLLFEHDYFTIEPLTGEVPARSRRDVVITFNPQLATLCEVGAYLDVVGRAERLPLSLRGQGIAPKCNFSYDALDLGDVFINTIHHYEVLLQNCGSIDARFSLNQTTSVFSNRFKFKPATGTVAPGQSLSISIAFCSDIIGILNEVFHFHIQGSSTDLPLHFKGRVIGPTFHFDVDEIDFGKVSFNFLHRRSFNLINTSEIPMRFRLRVPEDSWKDKEFESVPATGLVLPHGKQRITLDFLSNTIQEYSAHLVVDIDEVGENLHSIPLKASCAIPHITVVNDTVDFGKGGLCFVGHPYEAILEVRNDTQLSSKYEIGLPPADDPIRKKVEVSVDQSRGIVNSGSVQPVRLCLVAKLVGTTHLPVYVKVLGSDKRIPVSLSAKVTGPAVNLGNTSLEFGRVDVLKEHSRSIELKNESPIPAAFTCALAGRSQGFSLKIDGATIPPSSTYNLPVFAYMDDTTKASDEVVISVANSKDLTVGVSATGVGTTLVPSFSLSQDVDFGNVFTTSAARKVMTMYNKGKRALQITWSNDRPKPKEGEPPFTFTISPERATIPGKSELDFTFEGRNDKASRAAERFVCKLTKTHKVIFKATVVGTFVVPLLEPSCKSLSYTYTWAQDAPPLDPPRATPETLSLSVSSCDGAANASLQQSKPLTLRNMSPMPLFFNLRAGPPFTIDKTEYQLKQDESCTVHVELNAGYRNDFVSHRVKTKLTISYRDHPQKESIDLSADIFFPNVTIEGVNGPLSSTTGIDFGCIVQESEKRQHITITNTSKVEARFHWVFNDFATVPHTDPNATAKAPQQPPAGGAVAVVGCAAFDILPIRGCLKPGQAMKTEMTYSSQAAKKARATAVLVVEGGPDYPLPLKGEGSTMHFRFDRSLIDFGTIAFDKSEEREVHLFNLGKVAFPFTVDTSAFAHADRLDVSPSSGVVKGNEKVRLVLRMCPRLPDRIDDFIQVQVAHFEPHSIAVRGMGWYPSVAITGQSVRKAQPPGYDELAAEAARNLQADGRKYFLRGQPYGSGPVSAKREKHDDPEKQQATMDEEVERLYVVKTLAAARAAQKRAGDEKREAERKHAVPAEIPSSLPGSPAGLHIPMPSRPSVMIYRTTSAGPSVAGDRPKEEIEHETGHKSPGLGARRTSDLAKSPGKGRQGSYFSHATAKQLNASKTDDGELTIAATTTVDDLSHEPSLFGQAIDGKPVFACYTLDFGTVVKGDVKKKTVRIANTSVQPLTFSVNKKIFASSGVALTPDKAGKLAGHPSYGDQPLEVQLTTKGEKAKDVTFGDYVFDIPIEIRGSGYVVLKVKAFVMVPQLQLLNASPNAPIDFHETIESEDGAFVQRGTTVGETRIVTLQLFNPLPLPCEWTAKTDVRRSQPKNVFVCKPEKGYLAPKKRCQLQVMFVPFEAGTTHGQLNLKLAQNPKTIHVGLAGTGVPIVVDVIPPVLEFPAVLPFAPTKKDFVLRNKSSRPVEVYALSSDEVHGIEEEILRTVDIYDSEGIGLLPPREPGSSLDDGLLEQYYKILEEEDRVYSEAIERIDRPAKTPDGEAVGAEERPETSQASNPLLTPTSQAPLATPGEGAALGPVVVLYGPTLSGKSTIAKLLAKEYSCDVLRLDEVFETAVDEDSPSSLYIKNLLDPWPGAPAEPLNEEVLAEVLKSRLSSCEAGVVIDGLHSDATMHTDALAKALALASDGRALVFITLDVDEACATLRQARIDEAAAIVRRNESEMSDLDENTYDALEPAERLRFEKGLKRHRRFRTEAKEASAKCARLLEQYEAEPRKPTIFENIAKEEEARKQAEAEEAAVKKKPAGKKGAPPPPEVPQTPLEDLSPAERFEKLHPTVVSAFAAARVMNIVNNDEFTPGEQINRILTSGELPAPVIVESEVLEEDAGGVAPPPQTLLRVERPQPAAEDACSPWFRVLERDAEKRAAAAAPDDPAPAGRSRWIIGEGEELKLTLQFRSTTALAAPLDARIEFGIVGCKHRPALSAHAVAAYPDVVRDPKAVFTSRKLVKRSGAFDFGPVLVQAAAAASGKPDEKPGKGTRKQSATKPPGPSVEVAEVLKVHNEGLFEADIRWCFAAAGQRCFQVVPDRVVVKPGATEKVKIVAAPDSQGVREHVLVGLIKNNPEPVVFNVACTGCVPSVRLTGCAEPDGTGYVIDFGKQLLETEVLEEIQVANTSPVPLRFEIVDAAEVAKRIRPEFTVEVAPRTAHPAPPPAGGSSGKGSALVLSRRPSEIAGAVPHPPASTGGGAVLCKSRLEPVVPAAPESPTKRNHGMSGRAAAAQPGHAALPKDRDVVTFAFKAPKADVFRSEILLLVRDDVEGSIVQTIPIRLVAEAYDIYLEATEELSLGKNGLVKTNMPVKAQIKVCNRGKYPFTYQVHLRKRYANFFKVDPPTGLLKPKDPPSIVNVSFVSAGEVCFRDAGRAELDFGIYSNTENAPAGLAGSKPVFVEVEARHMRFQVVPSHGLNFGPCLSNDRKKMPLDIINSGPFELRFKLYDAALGAPDAAATPEPTDKKAAKKPAAKASGQGGGAGGSGELEIGAFRVSPAEGVVQPGTSREVIVVLEPRGGASQVFSEKLGVAVEDCNACDLPPPLVLEGESCTPGISANLNGPDADLIFEEQQVVSRLDPVKKQRSVFAREERIFSFGPIITRQSVTESFRVSNPFTVSCTVTAAVKSRGESESANTAASAFQVSWLPAPGHEASGAEEVSTVISIPPHEHRYVSVRFTPKELRSYFALFDATVKDGIEPKTKELVFELRGDGSLPQLQVDLQPPPPKLVTDAPTLDAKGKPIKEDPKKVDPNAGKPPAGTLVFPRALVGGKSSRYVTVTNVGDLPAQFKFTLPVPRGAPNGMPFAFPRRNEVLTLSQGDSESYSVYFEPQAEGPATAKLLMNVTDNVFEDSTITLTAEGYHEAVAFENLEAGCENFLKLPDCGPSQPSVKTFTLTSHSQHPIRYQWAPHDSIAGKVTFTPSAGHLYPSKSREVTVQYLSAAPDELEKGRISLKYWPIAPKTPNKAWNSTMTSVWWEPDITPPATPKPASAADPSEADAKGKKNPKADADLKAGKQDPPPAPSPPPPPIDAEVDQAKLLERKRRPLRKVAEPTPEPEFEYLPASGQPGVPPDPNSKDLFIKVTCDNASWAIVNEPEGASILQTGIRFSTTKLFQSRSYPVSLKNTGKVSMECLWKLLAPDGSFLTSDTDDPPVFTIDPPHLNLAPGETAQCRVTYAPLDTNKHEATLLGGVPMVKPDASGDAKQPRIAVSGSAECPLVHFDIPESDYITSGRRNPELANPVGKVIDASTKVIEFSCSGVRVRTTRRFHIINPTNMSYEYTWTNNDPPDSGTKPFACITQRGVVHSGKRAEIVFDFAPENLDLKESFWQLAIGGRQGAEAGYFKPMTLQFLLVGRTSEPNVVLNPTRIQYGQVLLGARVKKVVQLTNSEAVPFSYSFAVTNSSILHVSPSAGSIPGHSTIPVEVTFVPSAEEGYNLNIMCSVKKMTAPLTCNVKGEGFSIHESIVVKNNDGTAQLLAPGQPNVVDFGKVHVNATASKQIIVSNSGKLRFDYKWVAAPSSIFSLTPMLDTVGAGCKSVCDLTFHSSRPVQGQTFKMTCKITNGSSYSIIAQGTGVQPNLAFSSNHVDFGCQFVHVQNKDQKPKTHQLTIVNNDASDVSFESDVDLPPWLENNATPSVLSKAGTKERGEMADRKTVTFTFKPTEPGKYHTVVPFQINGMYPVNVHVSGEATVPKIELVPGQSPTVNFGSVRAGDLRTVQLRIVCKSKIPTAFALLDVSPPGMAANLVTVVPADGCVLRPRETKTIEFKFKTPRGMRLAPFSHEIDAEIAGQKRHFVTLAGSSIGMEVHLDQKTLSFGTVVQGTKQTKRALIMNTGDIPVSFQWPDLSNSGFSIQHPTGHMPPHSEASCDVTFAPTAPSSESHRDIVIKITDSSVNPPSVTSLPLSLVGVCSKRPAVAEEHHFKCPVRSTCQKTLKVTNPTAEDWHLPPALDCSTWSVPDTLAIPANSTIEFAVTYKPLLMTKTSAKGEPVADTGMLFIPLPTGDAKQMMHELIGEALPPGPAAEVDETLTAKTPATLPLLVDNWLQQSQRFTVSRDFVVVLDGATVPLDSSTTVAGADSIDVPPNSKRNYKLSVTCFKECKIKGTVRFVSEATGEYVFYNVTFQVKGPKDLKTAALKTSARQLLVHEILIENPLDVQVSLDATSSGSNELSHPNSLAIGPRSTGRFHVEYLPLIQGQEKQAKLVLKCPELGEFPYSLSLTALPPPPEKSVRFTTTLGQSQQLTIRLRNLAKVACDYTCKFASQKTPFFKSQGANVVKAGPATKPEGEEFSFDVTFEPFKLGEARDTLEVTSPVGGSFTIALLGSCTLPQRQGPVECKTGTARPIPFKNVFNDPVTFTFVTDSPSFTVAKPSEVVPAKKEIMIPVTFKSTPDDPPFPKAKLTISCQLEQNSTPTAWVYYLSGTS